MVVFGSEGDVVYLGDYVQSDHREGTARNNDIVVI